MGCRRTAIIDGVFPLATGVNIDLANIPETAQEGQMTFRNTGTSAVTVKIGQRDKGSRDVSPTKCSITLLAGEGFTDEGIVAGWISAYSDAAGLLQLYLTWR